MNATLFCCLTRRPAAFLAIWGGQPKAQPPFLNFKGQPALLVIVGLAAALRVLCRKYRQPLFKVGIMGLYLDHAVILVKTDGSCLFSLMNTLVNSKSFCLIPCVIVFFRKIQQFLRLLLRKAFNIRQPLRNRLRMLLSMIQFFRRLFEFFLGSV